MGNHDLVSLRRFPFFFLRILLACSLRFLLFAPLPYLELVADSDQLDRCSFWVAASLDPAFFSLGSSLIPLGLSVPQALGTFPFAFVAINRRYTSWCHH